jgi:hypothetical protein
MTDTNSPLTPRLPHELHNLETFYNPKPGDKGNIALLTHDDDTCEDEMLAYPYKDPDTYLKIISDDVEFVMLIYLNMTVILSLLLKIYYAKSPNIGGKLYLPSSKIVKKRNLGRLFQNPKYQREGKS